MFNTGTGETAAPGMASRYREWGCPGREPVLSFRVRQQPHKMPRRTRAKVVVSKNLRDAMVSVNWLKMVERV